MIWWMGPEMAPHTPRRSERPGAPVALLYCPSARFGNSGLGALTR
jgi:hypothetical protein